MKSISKLRNKNFLINSRFPLPFQHYHYHHTSRMKTEYRLKKGPIIYAVPKYF